MFSHPGKDIPKSCFVHLDVAFLVKTLRPGEQNQLFGTH